MADVSKIKLPNGTTYNIKDNNALPLTGGSVTGPVSFGDSVTIDEATVGDLVVNGNGSFTNNIQANTINGVEVGAAPSFTDTVTTVTTTGSGNAVTAITASDGALTVTKGSTFSTSDTKVYQSYKTASEYTYWRPLLVGYSSGSAASFTPSDQTNLAYTFTTLKVQPSTGTIRVNNLALYKGSYTTTFTPTTLTADRTITIPDKAGTMALTSDITSAIEDLPEPMIFKGSVGTGGTVTWANLATAAAANEGWTYKVITTHTAETGKPAAQVGDTIISNGTEWVVIPSGDEPSGTVTSVAAANATNGGLTISGSPITSSGTITIGHSNVLTSAQTTQAVYPIKIDKNGHISAYGSAVTIPTVPSATGSSTTGISIAAHGTGTVIGVQSSTTTVRGVKTGTNSTTTASKVTFGTAFSVPNPSFTDVTVPIRADADVTVPVAASSATTVPIKATSATTVPIKNADATLIPNVTSVGSASTWTFEEKTIPNVTSAGSASTWTFEEKSIPNVTSAGTASSWTFEEKSIPNVTAAGSGSASLTFTMDTTDTKKLIISFSHTHTAPTLGTAIKVQSKSGGSNGTAPTLGTAIKVQSKSGGANGSAPTLGTAIKVQSKSGGANGTAPTLGTDISIIGVQSSTTSVTGVQSSTTSITGVSGSTTVRGVKTGTSSTTTASKATLGTAISVPNPSATDVTVPIRADADTTVPIKNTSASTFVTGTTHTVTDNGHTHTI